MEKKWIVKKPTDFQNSPLIGKYHPVILQLLKNRGMEDEKAIERFFNFDYHSDIVDPMDLPQMETAVLRIIAARDKNETVAVFGDYDADGVTATVLLCETLEKIGFGKILNYIPDRQLEGYGLNKEALEYLKNQGAQLIITVDCGVSNKEEVELAKKLGLDVVITDHHHIPKALPQALAVVNPKLLPPENPAYNLAGVGVAFKLAQALYKKANPEKIDQLKWALDLVAIGTIADCMPLLGENRILAKYGLVVLSKTRRQGLLEMFKVGRIMVGEEYLPNANKISFQIAPRINAAGRMDHASVSLKLIQEKDPVKARDLALELESRNQERQKMTGEIVREIKVIAESSFKDKKMIFAENEKWPVGILGLVAGKIADEYRKPTVVMCQKKDEYVGSLRSIPEFDIVKALEKCSAALLRFGGHSQAAGVRVAKSKIEEFYRLFSEICEREISGGQIAPEIEIDAQIGAAEINWDLVAEIKKMEPFGEGNDEPVFLAKNFSVAEMKIVGNGGGHLKMTLREAGGRNPKMFEAIGFGMGANVSNLRVGDHLDLVFNLQEDEWNGHKKIQLRIVDVKKSIPVV